MALFAFSFGNKKAFGSCLRLCGMKKTFALGLDHKKAPVNDRGFFNYII